MTLSCIRQHSLFLFFGLLRVSEFTSPRVGVWDSTIHLSRLDVGFVSAPATMAIHIKASKTDPFRVGCTIHLVPLNVGVCPVRAMRSYLRLPRSRGGPLFTFNDGRFLTRAHVARVLQVYFRVPLLSTHSFRIGGASALANAGVPMVIIQQLGRWRGDAFYRYLRLSPSVAAQSFRALFHIPAPDEL